MERTHRTSKESEFFFVLNFPLIFQKGTSRNQTFFIFSLFFFYFSLNKDHKRCNHKNWRLQLRSDVVYTKSASSLKSVLKPCQFFLFIFPIFFWQSQVWVGSKRCQETPQKISDFSDKRAKSYACFSEGTSSYGFRKAQHENDR